MPETPQYVYIMTNRPCGAFYIGRTTDLVRRVWQHRNRLIHGHSSKYRLVQLAYWELHPNTENAWLREKRLKRWRRAWKIELIESRNPGWKDLWFDITEHDPNPMIPQH